MYRHYIYIIHLYIGYVYIRNILIICINYLVELIVFN